jgi:FtsH-binding integral membrane protein
LLTAFLGATCVFICFTVSAVLAPRRSYLFLGGYLSSVISFMFLTSFVNLFVRSTVVPDINLYLGLFVFCGYVLFDTQVCTLVVSNCFLPASMFDLNCGYSLMLVFDASLLRYHLS